MSIQRFGNTREFPHLPTISQIVVHQGVVHLLGVTGDPNDDVETQTEQVLARIDQLLATAGTDKTRLLTAEVWLADIGDFDRHNRVWNAWVDPDHPPVRACVQADLWRPGLLVEIMVTAATASAETRSEGRRPRRSKVSSVAAPQA